MTSEQGLSRRQLLARGALGLGVAALPAVPAFAAAANAMTSLPRGLRPALLTRALAALDRHRAMIADPTRLAIADFSLPSAMPRLHLVNLHDGAVRSVLVAHGSGSDPAHTGWLHRFSNDPGSYASSEGAFVTGGDYTGRHGRSRRLIGLDPTNDNALARAIVIHAAWYANPAMVRARGQLGRSQGCFAVAEGELAAVMAALGQGCLLYSAKV